MIGHLPQKDPEKKGRLFLVLPRTHPHDQIPRTTPLPNARLAAARVEAWEGRDPGSLRVLLSNPRWVRRLLKFLELSGAGRIVEDGGDKEEAQAFRMDRWIIVWEEEEGTEGGA